MLLEVHNKNMHFTFFILLFQNEFLFQMILSLGCIKQISNAKKLCWWFPSKTLSEIMDNEQIHNRNSTFDCSMTNFISKFGV